jgi:hypothetical protein
MRDARDPVIPANAGIHLAVAFASPPTWIPAFAGMTVRTVVRLPGAIAGLREDQRGAELAVCAWLPGAFGEAGCAASA